MFNSVDDLLLKMEKANYLIDKEAATVVYLAWKMKKPLLVEGPAGVGKTELAKVFAAASKSSLLRLQCYEGLDEAKALYEWDYQKQLLWIQANNLQSFWQETKSSIYTEEFLLTRPLLQALTAQKNTVLLIDELDKSEEAFESFLLETLSEYQISIPEYKTIQATRIPMIIITSNSAREFSEPLRRRCFHLYLDYPSMERELKILRSKLPGIDNKLSQEIVNFIQILRKQELKKLPSVAETIDWAESLLMLNIKSLDTKLIQNTLMLLVKYREDFLKVSSKLDYFVNTSRQ